MAANLIFGAGRAISQRLSGIQVFFCSGAVSTSALDSFKLAVASFDSAQFLLPLQKNIAEKVSVHVKVDENNFTYLSAFVLKSEHTRHTGTIRADLVPDLVSKHLPKEGNVHVKFICKSSQVMALTSAIARSFPKYSKKSKQEAERTVFVEFETTDECPVDYQVCQTIADSVRFCAELVDTPTSELHTDSYVQLIKDYISSEPQHVTLKLIQGEDLRKGGFGGLWGVGKAAAHLPALVILSYDPPGTKKSTCLVGKGIVYDTGGLSIKGSTNMPDMKADMGGSAAVFSAFQAAVKSGYKDSLHAILCLAENSVDKDSTRPDDILYMYSGKSVEVNNTDAEGRLVLADGVAYASRHLKPDTILDIATLTGAQLICTGEKHAAILTPHEDLEKIAYEAGQASGDWVYPILYAPEILKKEFKSEVADMKNSVKNRGNAQSSCAGHFIEDHLDENYKGKWIHVDIAGPAFLGGRGTGFGVGFLLSLIGAASPVSSK